MALSAATQGLKPPILVSPSPDHDVSPMLDKSSVAQGACAASLQMSGAL
jgi:hypothetical protein